MARVIWLAVVAAIVAAGVAVVVFPSPRRPAATGPYPVPAQLEYAVAQPCLEASGALDGFDSLSIALVPDASGLTSVLVAARIVDGSVVDGVAPDAPRRDDADRAAALRSLNACLRRTPIEMLFAFPAQAGAIARLYQYHVTEYWPCLRRNGFDPGPEPKIGDYVAGGVSNQLHLFEDIQSEEESRRAVAAARRCVFLPGDVAPLPLGG